MGIKKFVVAAMSAGFIMSVWSVASMADSNTGWRDNGQGDWRYYTSANEYLTDCWKKDNGKWYYLYSDGTALKNTWAYINGKLYYFNSSCAMETNKWIECGDIELPEDEWYLIGNMKIVFTEEYEGKKEYRYVDSSGAAVKGWQKIGGDWYYFSEDNYNHDGREMGKYCMMTYGFFSDKDGSCYCFDGDGKMITDSWVENSDGLWWYFGSDGRAYDGWHNIDGSWYCFTEHGDSFLNASQGLDWTHDRSTDEFALCLFDENCKLLGKGWHEYKGNWYYARSNGYLYDGSWLELNGVNYYFDYSGALVSNVNNFFIDGKLYNFNAAGACTNFKSPTQVKHWYKLSEREAANYIEGMDYWVYVRDDGSVCEHCWEKIGGSWYYFDWGGYMYCDVTATIDGKRYEFDSTGNCVNPYPNYRGWHKEKSEFGFDRWYYYDSNGNVLTGWQKIGNSWYYFDEIGGMYQDGLYVTSDNYEELYYFDDNGRMLTGWFKYYYEDGNYAWYYADPDGLVMDTGWKLINGNWYYFYYGAMAKNRHIVNDLCYDFDENGVCLNPYNGEPRPVLILNK